MPDVLQMSEDMEKIKSAIYDELIAEHGMLREELEHSMSSMSHTNCEMFSDRADELRPVVYVDLRACYRFLHDGLRLPHCGFDSYAEPVSYHGTHSFCSFKQILNDGGVMQDSRPERSEGGHVGWYHAGKKFERALAYAGPTLVGGIPVRIVLVFRVACCNSCNSGRYTGHHCPRYKLTGVYAVPLYVIPRGTRTYADRPFCSRYTAYLQR